MILDMPHKHILFIEEIMVIRSRMITAATNSLVYTTRNCIIGSQGKVLYV